jgi:hypothetical protein
MQKWSNDLVDYDAVLSFTTDDGRKCSLRQRIHVLASVEDNPGTTIVYAPDNPSDAVLPATLPGRPCINEAGQILFKEPVSLWASLLLPTTCLVSHSYWAWLILLPAA